MVESLIFAVVILMASYVILSGTGDTSTAGIGVHGHIAIFVVGRLQYYCHQIAVIDSLKITIQQKQILRFFVRERTGAVYARRYIPCH